MAPSHFSAEVEQLRRLHSIFPKLVLRAALLDGNRAASEGVASQALHGRVLHFNASVVPFHGLGKKKRYEISRGHPTSPFHGSTCSAARHRRL